LAGAHAAVGETEKALIWLDGTIDRGMIIYPVLSEHDLYLENIRGTARFDQAMARVRRERERFEV
jgi:hypothetical protein